MAEPTLPVLSPSAFPQPAFPQTLEDAVHYEIRRIGSLVNQVLARHPGLHRCDFTDEYCDCRKLATVHHLASELDVCERHFRLISKGGN